MAKILIVEDDKALRGTMEKWLKFEHHSVESAGDGNEAADNLRYYKYDLVILDWSLPGMEGVNVLKEFRSRGGTTPVLMLTGKKEIEDKAEGLDAGADDYLTKPFHMKELSARIRALLRRPGGYTKTVIEAGDINLDPANYLVTRSGQDIQLSQMEFALLEFLMRNSSEVFSPEALLDRVWKSSSDASTGTVRTHIKTLRKKLDTGEGQSLIRNVHGVGYKFEPPA